MVSVVYTLALAGYALFMVDAMLALKPNEFAEFLAGVFAPLAFLWLVLGFRQQGDELQNSARALWLQGEELRNSVEQQRQLVEVSREQLAAEFGKREREEAEAERAAQPRLLLGPSGGTFSGTSQRLRFPLTNAGPSCINLEVLIDGKTSTKKSVFAPSDRVELTISYGTPAEVRPVKVLVIYDDTRGHRRAQAFDIPAVNAGPGGVRTLGEPLTGGAVMDAEA